MNDEIIKKLWNNEPLTNVEITMIMSALDTTSKNIPNDLPYQHHLDGCVEAMGFKDDRSYKIFAIEENAFMAKSFLNVERTSQAVEVVERRILQNVYSRRAFIFSTVGKNNMSKDEDD